MQNGEKMEEKVLTKNKNGMLILILTVLAYLAALAICIFSSIYFNIVLLRNNFV